MIYWLLTLWLPFLLDIADAKLLVKTQKSEIPPPAPASLTVERMRNGANMEERQARMMGVNYVWANFSFSYDVGCQEGSPPGIDYDGIANMTTDGFPCVVWSESNRPDYELGNHNQCRNPDSDAGGVWCYTEEFDAVGFQWGSCPVPRCAQTFLSVEAKAADWNPPRASTPLPDQFNETSNWTLCASFSIDEWSDADTSVFEAWSLVYSEKEIPGMWWVLGYMRIRVSEMNTVYIAEISPQMQLQGTKEAVLFPSNWVHACVSKQQIDDTQAKMQLVVGGDLLEELVGDFLFWGYPSNFSLFLGEAHDHPEYNQYKHRSKRTNVNMFSSALPVQRMVGMTKGGGEDECGEAGDLLSWTEVNWEVENNATMMQLTKDVFGSCRKESSLSVFNLAGKHRVEDCMQQCG